MRIILDMGYVELHFHLLPGVDDGPASMDESIALARAAAADGTDTVVTTPHVNRTCPTEVSTLPERVQEVADRLRSARVPLRVVCGAELDPQMLERLSQRELDLIAHGPPDRRWVLLEAPLSGLGSDFTVAADELRARGFAAVIAHPERALGAAPDAWQVLEHELAAGSAMQVNAWSVIGLYGDRVRFHALHVLKTSAVVALASDAHGEARPPSLRLALEVLDAMRVRGAESMMSTAPRALLEGGVAIRHLAAAA